MGETAAGRSVSVRLCGDVVVSIASPGAGELEPRPTGSRQLRTLLALLAIPPGEPVGVDTLIDELWGESLPRHPRGALQVQMTRLREWLGASDRVRSIHDGYVLALPGEAVDLDAFHATAENALDPDVDDVLERTAAALARWRGTPFLGCVLGPRLSAERIRATERLLRVVERRAEALLAAARPDEAAELVLPHLADHRDRERLTLLGMRALSGAGRGAEALAVFAETRRHLRVTYGVAPSPELAGLEQELLAAPSSPARTGPDIVGRDGPLVRLRGLLDDPDSGRVVVLVGEAGIGKTSVLRAARDEAGARGARVGAGAFDEDATPFGGWMEALTALTSLPRPGRGPLGPALRARLAELVDDVPLLLTLDDVHRGDAASLGALRALARLGLPAGVLVVVAAREPDAVAHPGWDETHADVARTDTVVEIRLEELDEDAVRHLVGRRLTAPDADGRVADALWARTRGHALHLGSLLDVVADLPDDAACLEAAAEVPARLRPLLDHQVARMTDDCRGVLAALSVLHPLPAADLARVLDTDVPVLADRLRPAVGLGLVESSADRFAFRHDLTARAVLDAVAHAERAELHRRRLTGLSAGVEPFERLRHAVGAAGLVDDRVVADARTEAAWTAYRRGALDDALGLLDAALDATRPSRVAVRRGLVLEALGRGDEADDQLDAVLDALLAGPGSSAEPDVADAVTAAVGDDALGITVCGRVRRLKRLRRVRALPLTTHQRVQVLRALIVEEEQLLGDVADESTFPELRALVDGGGERGTGDVDPRLLAQVRLLEANRLADAPMVAADRLAVCEEALALAVRADDDVLRLEAQELLVAAELAAGRVDAARARHARLEPEAHRRRRPRSIWAVDMVRTSLLLARGEIEAADAAALATMTRGQDLGIIDAGGAYGVYQLARHWLAGTLPSLNGLPAGAAGLYPKVAAWAAAAAIDAAQAGDPPTAAQHLAEFHRRRAGRPGRMFDRPGLALAATAAYALGDPTTARVVLDGFPPDPDAVVVVGIGAAILGPVALHQGLAQAVLGETAAARELFTRACDVAARQEWTPWRAAAEGLVRATEGADRTHGDVLPFGLPGGTRW